LTLEEAREIRSELIEPWRNKPISEITRGDVVALVEAIADRPAPYHAHNVFGHSDVFQLVHRPRQVRPGDVALRPPEARTADRRKEAAPACPDR
jgi:hypothetical protein